MRNIVGMLLASAVVLGTACSDSTSPVPKSVVIEHVSPNPVSAPRGNVVSVTIAGRGFTADSNVILLDDQNIGTGTSRDGRTITFVLPPYIGPYSESGPQALQGEYKVAVRNMYGTSNAVLLSISAQAVAP